MQNIEINGIEYLELYVGNLLQAVHFYKTVFGFMPIAQKEKNDDSSNTSILLQQNDIYLILTSSLHSNSDCSLYTQKHGDGVKDVALSTNNTMNAFNRAIKLGAKAILEPTIIEDEYCKIIKATIATFGDTQHSFIERTEKTKIFLPNFKPIYSHSFNPNGDLLRIDHLAICVSENTLSKWSDFYKTILGFTEFYKENIYSENSGMNSIVVQNRVGNCKLTILEPVTGKDKSQIQKFIDNYEGDGVQHIAFSTDNIVHTVDSIRKRGLDFLSIPHAYYTALPARIPEIKNVSDLEKQQILVDRDTDGLLFQIFSKAIQSRQTFFVEIIQRQGAQRFGSGNIKALFDAVVREQQDNEHN